MNFWTRLFRSQNTDLDAEIESHLAMAAADKQANGADAKTAAQLARREFGNVALVKDVSHELTNWMWLERLGRDFRFAMRQITRTPGFSFAVILTLALGIGVNTAVFSMVNGFMLRPLPYPDADRIASLIVHSEGTFRTGQFGVDDDDSHTFEDWNLVGQNVTAVQAAAQGATTGVNLQTGAQPGAAVRYVHATRVSAGYFDVLGIRPLVGRGFSADEDRPDGPKAVVLGYALWQSAFGGDPHVLGKGITLKGEPYTVVGVLPKGARSQGNGELFTPSLPVTQRVNAAEITAAFCFGSTTDPHGRRPASKLPGSACLALKRLPTRVTGEPGSMRSHSPGTWAARCGHPFSRSCSPSALSCSSPVPISLDSPSCASIAARRRSPPGSPWGLRAAPSFVSYGLRAYSSR